jgi:biopolymer transport protein ExbD
MKLNSPLPHRKARIEIIPLIDIMFFLLASFMLVSMSMIKLEGLKMSLPQASTATREDKPDFMTINVAPTGDVTWEKDPTPLTPEMLTEKLKPVFAENKDVRIYINADRDATHGTVVDVLDRVKRIGIKAVSFAIRPGGEKVTPPAAPAGARPNPPASPQTPQPPAGVVPPPVPAQPATPSAPAAPVAPVPPVPAAPEPPPQANP